MAKNILLAITGGIAAYKSAYLARLFVKESMSVRVVMTKAAQEFITPLTLQAITGQPVATELLDLQAEAAMGHIELAKWADYIVIAPASADCIAKLHAGLADDLLSTLVLASQAQLLIAPAMNQQMWANAVSQRNILQLQQLYQQRLLVVGPASGEQACGDMGLGRMSEPEDILAALQNWQQHYLWADTKPVLQAKKVVITAGPTQEALDPVRYITNHSSGKMGYALAQAAAQLGAHVLLISGPVKLQAPPGVEVIEVISAESMLQSVLKQISDCDVFIASAAVADYRAQQVSQQKMKKQGDQTTLHLTLQRNPDILASVAARVDKPICIGFAAETHDVIAYAQHKRQSKGIDWIVANDVSDRNIGFHVDDNQVTLIGETQMIEFDKMPKKQLAFELLLRIFA